MRPQLFFRHWRHGTFVGPDALLRFAADIGLESVARNRFSLLVPFQIMLYEDVFGIEPQDVMREIYALEGRSESCTKPSTPFRVGGPLDGLYHKHFTTGSIGMVASNMLAANGPRVLRRLADKSFAAGFSEEAIASFA